MIGHGCEWKIAKETGKAQCVAVISRDEWRNARFGTGKDGRVYAAVGGGGPRHLPVNIFERIAAGQWKLRTTIATDEENPGKQPQHLSVWSDRNDDQQQQADEVRQYDLRLGAWIDGWYLYFNQAMTFAGTQYRIDVTGWTPCGAPEYDLAKAVKLPTLEDAEGRGGMAAQKGLVSEDQNFVLYNAHYGVEHSTLPCYDVRTGKLVFAYPSNYVGVHGGHLAPPGRTGLIRAAYDIVGTVKMPPPLDNLFVIGTDKGEWHILSSAGYYVSGLFEGDPMKIRWPDQAIPGANIEYGAAGIGAEDFGGSIIRSQRRHGVCPGRQDGLHQLQGERAGQRQGLGCGRLAISPADRLKAQQFKVKYLRGEPSILRNGQKIAAVENKAVTLTGRPREDFGTQPISFGSDYARVQTWLAHDADKLYVAWQVDDKTPWVNGATGIENMYAARRHGRPAARRRSGGRQESQRSRPWRPATLHRPAARQEHRRSLPESL